MTEINPNGPQNDKSAEAPKIDITKASEAAERAADETAQVVNQYFGTEIKSSTVHRVVGAVGSIALTAGVAYLAGKRGVRAGMKGYVFAGQSLVDAAGNYADIAQQNALITADNAAASHAAVKQLSEAVGKAAKNLKK